MLQTRNKETQNREVFFFWNDIYQYEIFKTIQIYQLNTKPFFDIKVNTFNSPNLKTNEKSPNWYFYKKLIKSWLPSPIASGMCPEKSKQLIYTNHILKTYFIRIFYMK